MARRSRTVAVIGAGEATGHELERARTVGRLLAEAGCVVINGGLGGVMEAASAGAADAGGTVLGILPGDDPRTANPHVTFAVATGMGDARNAIIANTADGFVAVGGAFGTLSEIAFALKRGKPVVALGSWDVHHDVTHCDSPEAAVQSLLAALRRGGNRC